MNALTQCTYSGAKSKDNNISSSYFLSHTSTSIRLATGHRVQFSMTFIIDREAGEIICLVASMCLFVCPSVRLSVYALLVEPIHVFVSSSLTRMWPFCGR